MAEYISLGISIIATIIAVIGILQTKKTVKINSNQFLFDKRLEIINLYKAVIYVTNEVANVEITNEDDYYTDIMNYKERSKDLIIRIKLDYSGITNHALFYELYNLSKSTGTEEFGKERINVLLFRNVLNELVGATEYLLSDKDLQTIVKNVLSSYDSILRLYIAIFSEITTINSNESIRVILLTHENIFTEVEKLKLTIEQMNVEDINSKIAKELRVF
ncbi:hypothetical protein [Enterococcus gilvus]|uniref:hypothetical protein n=1 Tax=Enterococcus gilvus TaxID=160453 RepID=UPI00345E6A91